MNTTAPTSKYSRASSYATLLVLLVAMSAHAWRDELKSAQGYLDIGAYAQAVTQLELPLQDPALKGSKRQRAE